MRFRDYITVPAGTTFNVPATKVLKLGHGIITEIEIHFPAGCNGLVHLAIDHYEHQAFPTNPNGSFIGDDQTISMSDSFPILEAPFSVKLRAWAPSAAMNHNVYVEFSVADVAVEAQRAPIAIALPEEISE